MDKEINYTIKFLVTCLIILILIITLSINILIGQVVWNGTIDSKWSNPSNWSGNILPDVNSDVLISKGKQNYPELNKDADVNSITIENGAKLSMNIYNLNVYGDWINDGDLIADNGTVIFKGTKSSRILRNSTVNKDIMTEDFEKGLIAWNAGSIDKHTEWRVQKGDAKEGINFCSTYDLKNNILSGYCNSCPNDYVDLARTIDLRGYTNAKLTFYWRGKGDIYRAGYVILDNIYLSNELYNNIEWKEESIDLSSYCGDIHLLIYRFSMLKGGGDKNPGFSIDNIKATGTTNSVFFNNIRVEKSDGALVALESPIIVNNLEIAQGSYFSPNGKNINCKGKWLNNGFCIVQK